MPGRRRAGSEAGAGLLDTHFWSYVSVADEGPGIAEGDRSLVFERFRRGTGDQTAGSGLGLAIARQIAESHDGRLVLADAPGPGSTFVLWLPERAVAGPRCPRRARPRRGRPLDVGARDPRGLSPRGPQIAVPVRRSWDMIVVAPTR